MTTFINDLRYAFRQLSKSPGFAVTAVLTLALGIGATTAIFTLVHAVLLRSLPVGNPSQLYRIGDQDFCCVWGSFVPDSGNMSIFPYDLYLNFKQAAPEFEQLAAVQAGTNAISVRYGKATAKASTSEYVTGNYFSTLGVGAFAGRLLSPADDKPSAPPAAVLSYQAWQADFAADRSIVGSTVYIQGQPVTIVGIAQAGFFGDRITPNPPAFWIPLAAEPTIAQSGSLLHHPGFLLALCNRPRSTGYRDPSATAETFSLDAPVASYPAGIRKAQFGHYSQGTHCAHSSGSRHSERAAASGKRPAHADDSFRVGSVDCLR